MTSQQFVPQAHPLSLAQFFQSKYAVPKYQRYYTWTSNEIEALLDDLFEFATNRKDEPYYLLGQVLISTPSNHGDTFEVIDGQQRVSTLMIIFAEIQKRLSVIPRHLSKEVRLSLEFWQSAYRTYLFHQPNKLRVIMSGKAEVIVAQYAQRQPSEAVTPSQTRITEAIGIVKTRFDTWFDDSEADWTDFKEFIEALAQRVFFIRLLIEDPQQAFDFFERVNHRGMPLGDSDLLKNRLLQNIASDDEFDSASDQWDSAASHLLAYGNARGIDFMLRQFRIEKTGQKFSEKSLYVAWRDDLSTQAQSIQLAALLEESAPKLSLILQSKRPDGSSDHHSAVTSFMGFKQADGIRFAGRDLQPEAYSALSKRVEARAILSLLSEEGPQRFESAMPAWTKAIAGIRQTASVSEIEQILTVDASAVENLFDIAAVRMRALEYSNLKKRTNKSGSVRRIRFILAIANFEISRHDQSQVIQIKDLLTTTNRSRSSILPGFDIDHINPENLNVLGERDSRLGNMALLWFRQNRQLQNKPAQSDEKRLSYAGNKAVLTHALTSWPNADHDELVRALQRYRIGSIDDGWSEEDAEALTNLYIEIVLNSVRRDLGLPYTNIIQP